MKYFIGIDGGGSRTRCVITDENLNLMYKCEGGSSNSLVNGFEKTSDIIFNLINDAVNKIEISFDDIPGIVIGTAGAGRKDDANNFKKNILNKFANENISLNKLKVVSDAEITLEGAFSGKPGAILIAGTGSIIYGKNKNGKIFRAGGFGRLIGDEGSGYSIGKKGLAAVAKDFDGRGNSTLITQLLKNKFSIDNQNKLITEVYKNNFDVARAAELVIKAADENDETAEEILNEEANELINHISTIQKKLNEVEMKLCFNGSLITNQNYYSRLLQYKIENKLNNIIITQPDYPPELGAVLIAKNL